MKPAVVLYDGKCGLCHGIVGFLLKIDRKDSLGYAPLSGKTAASVARRRNIDLESNESVLLVTGYETPAEKVHRFSDAGLLSLKIIGDGWSILSWFRIVPRLLRDSIYRYIARRRYHWFRRIDHCFTPPAQFDHRFLP